MMQMRITTKIRIGRSISRRKMDEFPPEKIKYKLYNHIADSQKHCKGWI